MGKFTVLKNIFLIFLLVGVVLMVTYYAEPVKNMALGTFNLKDDKVLGASSERAHEITDKVQSDLSGHLGALQKQALEVTLGDIVSTLLRAQKIPEDINTAREFIKDQAEAFTK